MVTTYSVGKHPASCIPYPLLFLAICFSFLGSVCKIETCHSERLEGAKNLGLLPEIAFENEILTCTGTQVQVSSLRSSHRHGVLRENDIDE
jgi:hypothetical protein